MAGVAPGGDVGVVHDLFGEGLAALELGGLGRRAEHEQAVVGEQVGDARHERRFGAHHGEVDALAPREREQSFEVGAVDGRPSRPLAAVPGLPGAQKTWLASGDCAEGMDEGVLAAAAADNEHAHEASYGRDAGPRTAGDREGPLVGETRARVGLSWRKSTRAGEGRKLCFDRGRPATLRRSVAAPGMVLCRAHLRASRLADRGRGGILGVTLT